MNITIRDINPLLWKEAKIESVKADITIGQAINAALETWLCTIKKNIYKKKHKSFWDVKPYHYKGKDAGRLSTLVDETLYR